jgi:hypothetical protein
MSAILPVIQEMMKHQGIYIGCEPTHPHLDIPVVSVKGKLYAVKLDQELDPTRFTETGRWSGPFRAPHS